MSINVEAIAREVAPLLGEGWSVEDRTANFLREDRVIYARLMGPAGAAVGLHLETYPHNRIRISGCFPKSPRTGHLYGRHDQSPRIGVSPDRPAHIIAAEIKRRLLPRYLPLLAQAQDDQAADEARNDRAIKMARAFAAVLNCTTSKEADESHYRSLMPIRVWPELNSDRLYASVEVCRASGSMEVKLTTAEPEVVLALADFLKPYRKVRE